MSISLTDSKGTPVGALPTTTKERRTRPLCNCIETALIRYFEDLDGHNPGNIHEMVMSEVEKPLLEIVMRQTRGNQSKAAEALGINRGTLRKKLDHYGLV